MGFSKLLSPMRIPAERTMRIPLDLPRFGDGVPALICKFAGDGNDAYINAEFKAVRTLAGSSDSATRDRLERELEAAIYAEHVVVGWEHIYEDGPDGGVQLAAFSVVACKEFLVALAEDAPDQFKRIRMARLPSNFRDLVVSAEDLGKG